MARLNDAISSVIFGRDDTCLLCFQNIEQNAVFIDDQVVVDQDTEEISQILCFILGEKVASMFVMRTICAQCKFAAINSYKFIKMCKENSSILYNVVESVADLFEKKMEDVCFYKSLFVSLDTLDFNSKLYYDAKKPVNTPAAALKRFHSITTVKIQPKIQMTVDLRNLKRAGEPRRKRSSIIYDIPNIPTIKLIFNTNNPTSYKCKVCLKSFQDSKKLRWHYFRYHYPRNVKCKKCSQRFISEAVLQQHEDEHHATAMCSECGKHFTNKFVFQKHVINHNTTIICQECGRVYRSKEAFKKHITDDVCRQKTRKKAEQGIYECNYCNKRYCYKPYLAKHIKFEHENAEGFRCKLCNKTFYTQSLLQAHTVKHTQEKKFECQECNGRFVSKTSLLYHTRLHTGEKPYKCEHCDRAFLSASRRLDHVRRHHMVPSLKCNICDKIFKATGSLLKHKKRHYNPNSRLNRLKVPHYYHRETTDYGVDEIVELAELQ